MRQQLFAVLVSVSCTNSIWAQSLSVMPDVPQSPVGQQPSIESIQPWLIELPLKTRKPGITPEENELYYRVLAFARDANPEQVQQAAERFKLERYGDSKFQNRPQKEFPIYVDIYLNPDQYQGKPITLSGHLQRTVKTKAGQNEYGIDQLCEAWLYTRDSQSHPAVILATEFPEGMPIGEQVIDHVEVTGYFYRMYTYEARDTGRYAPLIMVNQIKWNPASSTGIQQFSWFSLLFWTVVLVFISYMIAQYLHLKSQQGRERYQDRDARLDPTEQNVVNQLNQLSTEENS